MTISPLYQCLFRFTFLFFSDPCSYSNQAKALFRYNFDELTLLIGECIHMD